MVFSEVQRQQRLDLQRQQRQSRQQQREQRDKAYKDNEEMREKYKDIEERMTQMDIKYRKDISRLGRRIDVLSPFLCGRPGCMDRTKVCLMDDGTCATYGVYNRSVGVGVSAL